MKPDAAPCRRCGGEGKLTQFSHVEGGSCFSCGGTGVKEPDWRSSKPVEQFVFMGQPVRVYRIKGALHLLVREKDYNKHGQTVMLDSPIVIRFWLNEGGRVSPYRSGASGLHVPWTVIEETYPDYSSLKWAQRALSLAERAHLTRMDRSISALGRAMLAELRKHYQAKAQGNPKKKNDKAARRRRKKRDRERAARGQSALAERVRKPSSADLQHYLGFVLYALMGRMNEADDILIAHGSSVKKMAAWLRGLQPLPLAPVLYRGILLNNLPASGPLPPDPRKAPYMSMAEDKDVACWFGNPHSSISNVAEFGQVSLGKHGVVVAMPSGPLHDRVLWHHAWQAIPDPTKPGALINLRTTAMHNFGAFGKAIVWALDTQKEVMVESRPGESLPFVRVEDAGCPPLAVLERKLGS